MAELIFKGRFRVVKIKIKRNYTTFTDGKGRVSLVLKYKNGVCVGVKLPICQKCFCAISDTDS